MKKNKSKNLTPRKRTRPKVFLISYIYFEGIGFTCSMDDLLDHPYLAENFRTTDMNFANGKLVPEDSRADESFEVSCWNHYGNKYLLTISEEGQ